MRFSTPIFLSHTHHSGSRNRHTTTNPIHQRNVPPPPRIPLDRMHLTGRLSPRGPVLQHHNEPMPGPQIPRRALHLRQILHLELVPQRPLHRIRRRQALRHVRGLFDRAPKPGSDGRSGDRHRLSYGDM